MSMLAERKQKQRFSLNPRGKFWTDDKNKFGQKMLEKMGWTSGKGLGAKENGIKESLKVHHKDNVKGLGYKEDDNAWTQHDIKFSKFLESLSAENSSEASNDGITKPKKSLEELSKSSRARVHYHKFTRSKDISKMSEKDLKSVFGKKDSSTGLVNPAFDTNDTKENSTDLSNIRTEIPDFGVTNFGFVDFDQKNNIKGSSEQEKTESPEYYKTSHVNLKDQYKQLFIKSNDDSIGKKQDVVEDVEKTEEQTKRSSKKSKRNREEDDHCHKKRSKLFKQELDHPVYKGIDNLGCTANTEEQKLEEVITDMSNKIDEYENEVENEINERKCVQMTETCEEVTTEVRKKKKSKKNKVDIEETDTNTVTLRKSKSDEEINTTEEVTSKKIKKAKRRASANDANLEAVSTEESVEVTQSIKKSKRRVSFGGTTVEIFDTQARIHEKKCKKSKKDKHQEILPLPEESPTTEIPKKQKKRKKESEENNDLKENSDEVTLTKKEKHNKLETIPETEEQSIDDSTEKSNDGSTKKKKKSKKNKEKANLDENSPNCQEDTNQSFETSESVEHKLKYLSKKDFLKRKLTNESGFLDINFVGSNLLKLPGYGTNL